MSIYITRAHTHTHTQQLAFYNTHTLYVTGEYTACVLAIFKFCITYDDGSKEL
jgi:hypothetical protein